jgi:transposase
MSGSQSTVSYSLFVGVDIAATTATVAWMRPGEKVCRPVMIEQTPEGYTNLERKLRATGAAPIEVLVVMEATGSYWITLATRLVQAGFQVSVINPAQAHHFAKALLKRAKTDAIDAQTLTQLAMMLRPAPWTPPPQIYYELQQRLAQRDALLDLQQQVRNQLMPWSNFQRLSPPCANGSRVCWRPLPLSSAPSRPKLWRCGSRMRRGRLPPSGCKVSRASGG